MNKFFSIFLFPVSLFLLGYTFSYAAFDVDLKSGSSGADVMELQNFLIKNNYLKVKSNGNYGPATILAVKAFQKKNKIKQTGTFGPATRSLVKKISKNNITSTSLTKPAVKNIFSKEINDVLNKNFTVSAWVPYWRKTAGSEEVIKNSKKIDIVLPFSFEMEETGTFKDPMKLNTSPYSDMIKQMKSEGKLIVPSILWWATGEERENLDFVLRDDDMRGAVIFDIKEAVKKYELDGIDIDFENKKAESREPFNKFLTELSKEMHSAGKMLSCTIEARTPTDSKFLNASKEFLSQIEYSNDFKHIGSVCDQVRIMAYDQQDDDKQLNNLRNSEMVPYKPVADIDWVEKVLTLAMRDIEWKKLIVGVPTYGNKYEIIRDANFKITSYKKIGSMNWFYADAEVKEKNITPIRNESGELSYNYIDATNNKEYYVVYSDAEAIAQKINIAKLYKIGGIAIFKVDGNNDKNIWSKI